MLNNAEVSASLVFHTPSQTAQTDIWQVQLEKKQNFFEIKQKKKTQHGPDGPCVFIKM